ncbi:MAG TPA: alpha-amylase family glycosyl hydrolase [Candidatus Saccharimonadales bacterium]
MTQAVGALVLSDSVSFQVWAPFASTVHVMGDFNNWSETDTALTKDDNGYWSAKVSGAKPGHEYKYVIHNGETKLFRNDPRALQITASGDNSIIVASDFQWHDQAFTMPPPHQQVIYEMHLGTFHRHDPATPGTFETTLEKIDHLASLGITTVELMPITSTAINRWWGYDPDYLFAVETSYGGHHALLEFVNAAHQRGIGVVLDVVYNHLSPYEEPDLWQFDGWNENGQGGIYFYNDWRATTPWGPRLDYGRPEVRDYIVDNALMWLRDCHIDGLRCDAVFAIRKNVTNQITDNAPDNPEARQTLQRITKEAKALKPHALLIAEDFSTDPSITKPPEQGGLGFDTQWDTGFPSLIRDALEPINDSDRNLSFITTALTKRYNDHAFERVIYTESHDADANGRARLNEEISPGDATSLWAKRRSTMGAAICLTAPGTPMLFQGQEFMEQGWFSHWQALDWQKAEAFAGIVGLYRDLIALRLNRHHTSAGLCGPNIAILHEDHSQKVLAYHRFDQGGARDDVIIVLNLSNRTFSGYEFHFPRAGIWKVRLNSDWHGYSPHFTNTPTPDIEVKQDHGSVNLGAYSFLILSQD